MYVVYAVVEVCNMRKVTNIPLPTLTVGTGLPDQDHWTIMKFRAGPVSRFWKTRVSIYSGPCLLNTFFFWTFSERCQRRFDSESCPLFPTLIPPSSLFKAIFYRHKSLTNCASTASESRMQASTYILLLFSCIKSLTWVASTDEQTQFIKFCR